MDSIVFLVKITAYTVAIGYFIKTLVKSLEDIENRNDDDKR